MVQDGFLSQLKDPYDSIRIIPYYIPHYPLLDLLDSKSPGCVHHGPGRGDKLQLS